MPYKNLCRRPPDRNPGDHRPIEPIPGLRLQWGRDQMEVSLAVKPMTWGSGGGAPEPMVEGDDPPESPAQWVSLGRYEINELIRTLRVARDQSCGRDE